MRLSGQVTGGAGVCWDTLLDGGSDSGTTSGTANRYNGSWLGGPGSRNAVERADNAVEAGTIESWKGSGAMVRRCEALVVNLSAPVGAVYRYSRVYAMPI